MNKLSEKMKSKRKKKNRLSELSSSNNLDEEDYPTNTENLKFVSFYIFLLSLVIYSSTCYRFIPGGDSTELIGNVPLYFCAIW